jgi:hypothetical protein
LADSLISWNRLLAGKLRDPLAASHVLAGFVGFLAGDAAINLVNLAVFAAPVLPGAGTLAALTSTTGFVAGLLGAIGGAPAAGMGLLVLVMLLIHHGVSGSRHPGPSRLSGICENSRL